MKEYTIYIKQGSGIPYMLDTYQNIESAKSDDRIRRGEAKTIFC